MQRDEEDEAWQAIVENYGERPALDDRTEPGPDEDPEAVETTPAEEPPAPVPDPLDEEFVPPAPPPVPRPPTDRLAAWCGLIGAPTLLVLMALVGVDLPDWFLLTLVGAFIAGFGYLVLTMDRDPRDPWDDGAQV